MAIEHAIELGPTLLESAQPPQRPTPLALSLRTTVLPRPVPDARAAAAAELPRFEPIRVLGSGGAGEVTLVRDNDIDRPVALKRLRADARSAPCVDRFVREIRTVGQLEHPNITPLHDVGVDDRGDHYFVMRYVEGETLESIIAKLAAGDRDYHRRFPFDRRVEIFLGVLRAIEYAHSKGIIHRDIKPSNIMVGTFGEVFVMDWGIATCRCTSEDHVVGTPAYMSPEQTIPGRAIDERSDVYSLCAVFYELLALHYYLPRRSSVSAQLEAVMTERPQPAIRVSSRHQPHVPIELSWFVVKGLAKEPDRRYRSVSEMVSELQRARAGRFPILCQVSAMKHVAGAGVRLIDRDPVLGMLFVLAVLGSIAFTIVQLLGRVSL